MSRSFDKIIRKAGDPVLKQVCEPVDLGRDNLAFLADLVTVCRKYRDGTTTAAGLAAPQIGFAKRAFATNVADGGTIAVRLFINPVIVDRSAETSVDVEGCLSYPGVTKAVRRHDRIKLQWTDLKGRPREDWFGHFHARVIQHEYDHLDGVCRVGDDSPAEPMPARVAESRPVRGPSPLSRALPAIILASAMGVRR